MKRLTRKTEEEFAKNNGIHYLANATSKKVLNKLGEYEDAEEQELLYRKIFFIGNYCHKPSDCPSICEYCSDNYLEVKDIVVEINRIHIYGEIDKTVFFTKEKAEQALAKMKEGVIDGKEGKMF